MSSLTNIDRDVYYTVSDFPTAEIKVKGSRFIAHVAAISKKESAIEFLESIRSKFYDATHNCFAYRIGHDGMEFRTGDDGEPSGSAGKPILFEIRKAELSDIIVIVTRYFGGTKLGVGGLARAYSEAASNALAIASRKAVFVTEPIRIFCDYDVISSIKRIIEEFAIETKDYYTDSVQFDVEIPVSKVNTFFELITAASNGKAGLQKLRL